LPPESISAAFGTAAESPQLYISTKLAKPTPTPDAPQATAPVEKSRWRTWAALGVATGLVVAVAGVGLRQRQQPASPTTILTPPTTIPTTPVAPRAAEAAPNPSSNLPSSKPTVPPEPGPAPSVEGAAKELASRTSPPRPQRKRPPERKLHKHRSDDSPRTTALDKNGIGIPSN
jgi:hypothetical protein